MRGHLSGYLSMYMFGPHYLAVRTDDCLYHRNS